jgi:gliding motility-associated-like protein
VLIATATSGCSDTADVTINSLFTPALGDDSTLAICDGTTIDLNNFYNTIGLNTTWHLGSTPVPNPSVVGIGGIYELVATTNDGCSDTALVTLNVNYTPALGADQHLSICNTSTLDLTSLYVVSGATSTWTKNTGTVANPTAISSTGIYQLVAQTTVGCSDTADVYLMVNTAPVLGPDISVTPCSGTGVDLNNLFSVTGLSTQWTNYGVVVSDPSSVNTNGIYQVIATTVNGCSDTAFCTINQFNSPSLSADVSYALCSWMTLDLSTLYNTSNYTVHYSFNGTLIGNYTAVYDSGIYAITVVDSNGCTDQALAYVTNVACSCTANFNYTARCLQDPVSFEIQTDSTIISTRWIFGKPEILDQFGSSPSVTFIDTDSMLVTMQAELTCGSVTVNKYIHVDDCRDSCKLLFPDAFSPNHDGLNDVFTWRGDCVPEEYLLEVYNRLGQLLFRTTNSEEGWDGKENDHLGTADVYLYRAKYKLPYQSKHITSGMVFIMR